MNDLQNEPQDSPIDNAVSENASPEPTSPEPTSPETTSPGCVLVVDDLPANVRLLESMLSIEGFEVVTASGGLEALEIVTASAPDVVLLDVMMPDMNGFEVCRRLKSDAATSHLPVVMVTALQDVSDRVRALEAGADDFLTKPVEETEVLARVATSVRAKRDRDALRASYGALQRAHADLQRAEGMRDSLSEMLVHDLRTPLTTMMVAIDMLQGGFVGEADEMQREVLQMCARGGQQLLGMINDLLDVSRMESGELSLKPAPISIGALINEAFENVETQAREAGTQITREVAPDLPLVEGDADLLRRALVNLLGNAVKFTPNGGSVGVAAFLGDNEPDARSKMLQIEVRDDGPGIAPDDFGRIFEKFGQAEMRGHGHKVSTGLGLTFCKLAVEAHGGRIWVESVLGQGSTFAFTLPLRAA